MSNFPDLLGRLASHPHLVAHPQTYVAVQNYFWGLAAGLRVAGIEWTWDDYLAAAEARGWDPRGNIGILRDFTRKGLSDEEMAEELVAVEVDAYRRALSRRGKEAEPGAAADGPRL